VKKITLFTLGICLAAIIPAAIFMSNLPDSRLHVYFLDVGQGDAVLVQQGSTQVLIDGGPSPEALTLELGRIMPFWDRSIELVISTHAHDDHLTGLVEVLSRYRVGQILEPQQAAAAGEEYSLALFAEWRRLIEARGVPVIQAQVYQQLRLQKMVIDILNPAPAPLSGKVSDIDNNAIALSISCGAVSFLLTADMSFEGEYELLMERLVSGCSVLKVGHHGSRTSSSVNFLRVVSPGAAVISVGDNNYDHPHPEVVARLEEMVGAGNVYRTDLDGTLEFITDGENLWLNSPARR
jgi:competence protein ComEC